MKKKLLMSFAICVATLPAAASDFSLTELIVKPDLKAGVPYDVALRYQGSADSVREVCFLWSGEGPYCWTSFRVDRKAKLIRTQARTGNPNRYTLQGFARYGQGGETNKVHKSIKVTK